MKPRGRPKKLRNISHIPKTIQFSPRGRPGRPDEVELARDEFEALRLGDFTGLSQKESAKAMGISQQTFSRILKKGRKKIADALISAKIIRISEGNIYPQYPQKSNKSP